MCLIQVGQYKYKINAQYLRLFGLHCDVNDAHRAGANPSPKQKQRKRGIAKHVLLAARTVLCQEQIDLVAGDLTQHKKSTIEITKRN